ncbi:hypothetical protein NEMBOFW57_008168 [Staphylotrichum longicolle]|uniref:Tetratricopeptide repeat protein n=1 Tax=Staphylotrichum longicolle TaxID=669026 RepID=A0AAD4HTY5_9PEZI|nr:hypothetical protein NEMBOFW57_008168 [Staphylotrichum longicolle]
MSDNQLGIRRLNYEIPWELEGQFNECLDRQRKAAAAVEQHDLDTATHLLKVNLQWCKGHLSTDPIHPMTLWHLGELGVQLINMGRFNEAIGYVGEAYDIRESIDPEGEDTLKILSLYARTLAEEGHFDLAAGRRLGAGSTLRWLGQSRRTNNANC